MCLKYYCRILTIIYYLRAVSWLLASVQTEAGNAGLLPDRLITLLAFVNSKNKQSSLTS